MVTWAEFGRFEPKLAERGRALFREHGIAYLATVRKDGSPRLHPISPILAGDGLYVAVSHQSPKRFDLLSDGRYVLHAMLGAKDEEFMLAGIAKQVVEAAERAAVVAAASHAVRDSDQVFEFLIERALWGYWEHTGMPDTYPVHRAWTSAPQGESAGA